VLGNKQILKIYIVTFNPVRCAHNILARRIARL